MLVLTALLVGPYFVDWTSYRADFEREASRILGREVTVEGAAEARLLPFPSVTFSDVRVAGATPGEPAMTVEEFSMDAELAPFMRGEILIFDMRLVRPRAAIEVAADGTIDWAVRPNVPIGARQITLEKLTVSDGEIVLHHAASGRTHRVSGIDAAVSARTLAGPWRIAGDAAFDGVSTGFQVSTGAVDEAGAMRLRLRLDPEDYPLHIETDGPARLVESGISYSGVFRLEARAEPEDEMLRAGDGSFVRLDTGEAEAKEEPADYRVTGNFALAHDHLDIEEFRLETGPLEDPYTADGTASLAFGAEPRFSVRADGAQIRMDDEAAGTQSEGVALDRRVAAVERFLSGLPRPTIPGEVEVSLPAIVVGDTTIRNVSLSAEPAPQGWQVNALSAGLPGRTTLEAEGTLATVDSFGFSGRLLLAVAQPSGFAAWIARDVDDAIRRLPAAGFEAQVELSRERQSFRELELMLGDARFEGAVERTQQEGLRPAIRFSLDGGALDVDGLAAFASLFVSEGGERRLADHDLDIEVRAGPVTGSGVSAESLDTALRLREGQIEIDRLSIGGLAGASISATGTVRNFPKAPVGNLDASVVAVDLAPLVALLAERFPQFTPAVALARNAEIYPGLMEEARLDFVASAAERQDGAIGVALSANGVAGGTRITFAGSAASTQGPPESWPLTVYLAAENPNAADLYALYGLPALPLGAAGTAMTELEAKGTLAGGLATTFTVTGEGLKAGFEGELRVAGGAVAAKGRASLDSEDLEPWLMTAGVSLPGFGLGLPVGLKSAVDFDGERLKLSRLEGSIAENALAAEIEATMRDGRPHLAGSAELEALDAIHLAGLVLGEPSLQGGGEDWPDQPFLSAASSPVTAELALSAKRLAAGALAVEDARFTARIEPTGIAIAGLEGGLAGGRLTALGELKNNGGTGLLSAQFQLAGARLDAFAAFGGLSGSFDLSASLTADGKSVDGMVASLSGSGTAEARDLVISGFDAGAFPAILAGAERIGREIDAAATARFAPALVKGGQIAAGSAEVAFTLAAGQLRAPPVRIETPAAVLTADLRADLAEGTAEVTGEIAYQAGTEALVGSEPVVRYTLAGPIGATELTLNTGPLAQFLTQRALEKEQARVEAMQAALLEKQRLRREVRYYDEREAERLRIAEEERRRAAAEARRRAEEQARLEAEAEARRQAEEEERQRLEEERARRAAEEAAARAAEENARREAEEAARREAEAARQREAEAARQQEEASPAATAPETIERAPLRAPDLNSPELQGDAEPGAGQDAPGLPGVDPDNLFDDLSAGRTTIEDILKGPESR